MSVFPAQARANDERRQLGSFKVPLHTTNDIPDAYQQHDGRAMRVGEACQHVETNSGLGARRRLLLPQNPTLRRRIPRGSGARALYRHRRSV